MKASLDSLSISGFRSIRELTDFPMRRLNVLIGANGSGKSNFVEFFRMLRAMFSDALKSFVSEGGGGDGFFFLGPRYTREISARLDFGPWQLRITLGPAPGGDRLLVRTVRAQSSDGPHWEVQADRAFEVSLAEWGVARPIYEAVSNWVVYHFHDTSSLAGMRRDGEVADARALRPSAENLAAFLRRMRDDFPTRYQRIRETVQIVAPFFDDFLLDLRRSGAAEQVRLDWRQKGSDFPFQPWQLSDGTIRFIALTTALLQPDPPATLVIDEPELGLHPAALQVLAALIHEASTSTQILVSTQSPLLVDHFEPDDVIVVRREGAESRFERQSAAELGRWLEEFTLGELMRKNVVETGP